MDEGRKRAYRHLLYWAMLDIRILCGWGGTIYAPRKVWAQYQRSRQVGALADWLHNVALYSKVHFRGFKEDWFWQEYERFKLRFPGHQADYKQLFEDDLTRWEEGKYKKRHSL